jgi:plasmid maintenance system killer protein
LILCDNHWWAGVAPQGLKGGEGAFVYRGLAPPAKIWRPRCGLGFNLYFATRRLRSPQRTDEGTSGILCVSRNGVLFSSLFWNKIIKKFPYFRIFCIFAQTGIMKVTFEDIELENLVLKHQSKTYKKYLRDSKFLNALDRIYFIMQSEKDTTALKNYSFLHYEKLKRVNMSSVRVLNGKVERLLFHEYEDGIEISLIEIDDTHYGQR